MGPAVSFATCRRHIRAVSLSDFKVRTSIAVFDMAVAREFYELRLGLSASQVGSDGSRVYACGGETSVHVYPSPGGTGATAATLATWLVTDLERVVDELSANGVAFERYDDPSLETDAKGIHEHADGRVAWFRDPDGNTFALEQPV
jgi:catechol 2,3-dioxygenase-like lactoylglutathione lyase family enzyme